MADVVLSVQNNQFAVVSGADVETLVMNNNEITVTIAATPYSFNPLSSDPNGDGNSYLKGRDTDYSDRITCVVTP